MDVVAGSADMVSMLRGARHRLVLDDCGSELAAYSKLVTIRSLCGMLGPMPTPDDPRYDEIQTALETAAESPARAAADRLTELIDDTMAQALVTGRSSLRSVGAGVGLSENAVGPRLARTPMLAPYANDSGRVTASGVERARYDHETGRAPEPGNASGTDQDPRPPMRFRPRRTT